MCEHPAHTPEQSAGSAGYPTRSPDVPAWQACFPTPAQQGQKFPRAWVRVFPSVLFSMTQSDQRFLNRGRVFVCVTRIAEVALGIPNGATQPFNGKITQGICSQVFLDLRQRVRGSNQLLACGR